MRCLCLASLLLIISVQSEPVKRNLADSIYWGKRGLSGEPNRLNFLRRMFKVYSHKDCKSGGMLEGLGCSWPWDRAPRPGPANPLHIQQFVGKRSKDENLLSLQGSDEGEKEIIETSEDDLPREEKRSRLLFVPWQNTWQGLFRDIAKVKEAKAKEELTPVIRHLIGKYSDKGNDAEGMEKKRVLFVPWQSTWQDLVREVIADPKYQQQLVKLGEKKSEHRSMLEKALWNYYMKKRPLGLSKKNIPDNQIEKSLEYGVTGYPALDCNDPHTQECLHDKREKCEVLRELGSALCGELAKNGETQLLTNICEQGLWVKLFRQACLDLEEPQDPLRKKSDSLNFVDAPTGKKYRKIFVRI